MGIVCFYFFFPAAWLSARISRQFEQTYHYKLSLPPISPFPIGSFSLGETTLTEPNGKLFARIGRLNVRYRILPLLTWTVSVDEVVARDIEIYLRKEKGEWNFDRLHKAFVPTPPPPGPILKVDYFQTPLDKLGAAIEKALAETMAGFPGFKFPRMSIERLRVVADDGEGNLLALPPIDLAGSFVLTSSERRSDFSLTIAQGSLLTLNRESYPIDLELRALWPGDRTGTARAAIHLSDPRATPLLTLDSEISADLGAGKIDARLNDLSIPGHLSAHGNFDLVRFGLERFSAAGELKTTSKRFAPAWESFLSKDRSLHNLPEISAQLDFSGKLLAPTLSDVERRLAAFDLPVLVNLNGKFAMGNPGVINLASGASLRSVEGDLSIHSAGDLIALGGALRISRLRLPSTRTGGIEVGSFDLGSGVDLRIEGLHTFRLSRAFLEIPTMGLKAEAKGSVSSTVPFPELAAAWKEPKGRVARIREAVTGGFEGMIAIDAQKVPDRLKGLSLTGELTAGMKLSKPGSDRATIELATDGKAFSISLPTGESVQNVNFHFPLAKTVYLGPAAARWGKIADASVWAKGYSAHLYPLSSDSASLRIAKIVTKQTTTGPMELDAGFDGSNLVVDRFALGLLGGSIWSKMTLLPAGDTLKLTASLEAVELDISRLTAPQTGGDARVGFDAQTTLTIVPGRAISPEGLLDDLAVQFHLTKIGDQTLDRLITFLDPKGENPSLAQARGLLQSSTVRSAIRNPRVSFSVAHGILEADIVLPGVKVVDLSIPIRGISVKNLLKFAEFRKSLSALAPALEATKFLSFRGMDDDGKLVFSKGAP
ncbi:MAG: hypothetical protein V1495_08420 [Pseudomonadota bacterium]